MMRKSAKVNHKAGEEPFTYIDVVMIVLTGLFLIFLAAAFVWRQLDQNSPITSVTLSYLAFLSGTILEEKRLSGHWQSILIGLAVASFFSLAWISTDHNSPNEMLVS